jgi:hypothetical protein
MQLGLFDAVENPCEAMLRPDQLAELLMEWDADPTDARLLARVRAQCGPTDSLRQARVQLAANRRAWGQHDPA